MKISVVIPAYNEASNIKRTVEEVCSELASINSVDSYEIIVVDDHSTDDTFDKVASLNNKDIKCIRLSRKSGSHTAIRAGFAKASGDAAFFISADGQENPKAFSTMISKLQGGSTVVWGLRKERKEPLITKLFALLFYKTIYLLTSSGDSHIDMSRADFFLLDRKVIDTLIDCAETNTSIFGLIRWLGFSQDFVEYERQSRSKGKTKWSYSMRLRLATDWIIAFSTVPLKLTYWIGLATSFISIILAAYLFMGILFSDKPLEIWPSILILILFVCGIQLITIGILGEYLLRTLSETRRRPLYIIEDSANLAQSK